MDAGPTPPTGDPRLPAVRPPGAVARRPGDGLERPAPHEPTTEPVPVVGPDDRGDQAPHRWRRLTRTRRGAAGLAILAAALLLWPFAGFFWIPWLAGLAVLVLIALLRLDRLLYGWAWHVGGLAVVAGLMLKTGPWDWAVAASLGVLLAGLVQLPWWRLAAVGAVLCLLAGTGWGIHRYRVAQEVEAQAEQTSSQNRGQLRVARAGLVLQVVLSSVGRGDVGPVCDSLLAEPARQSFAAAVGAPDCPTAVRSLASQVEDPPAYARGRAPSTPAGDTLTVDACHITWPGGAVPGPQLGVLTVGRVGTEVTYLVTAFSACSP
jgi:hypothetical protein